MSSSLSRFIEIPFLPQHREGGESRYSPLCLAFPGGSVVKNPPVKQETQVRFLGWEDLLEKEIATHSRILA